MKPLSVTVRLAFFSASFITVIVFAQYVFLISDMNSELSKNDINFRYNFFRSEIFILFLMSAFLSYFASAIIIDKMFNPVRLMIQKIKEIGRMNFSKPLRVNSADDELREYAIAFNEASQKLGSYIEQQKRFISDASHELVTPITIINGHSDLLLRHVKEHPEILETELRIIKEEAVRMGELVDCLLLLARSDSKNESYNFDNYVLSELISEIVNETKIIAPDFEFNVNTDETIIVKCDEYAIRRILRILLSNAVKYSGESRLIEIKAYKAGGLTNVEIKDYGIGISSADLPKIFDRFYRADESRSKKTGSSGLGLAIAKELISAHGGEISAVSTHGKGSLFNFVI